MNADDQYIRLTKLWGRPSSPGWPPAELLLQSDTEGTQWHRIPIDYVIDGWFLQIPEVGHPMVFLRFRRNELCRLGIFTSSLVTYVFDAEIHTENSVYKIEARWFETEPCHTRN